MIKILISVYIVAILLIAGFADASTLEATPLHFNRINDTQKVWLNIADARFDSRREILILSGYASPECLKTINSELQLDERTNNILVSVTAQGNECMAETESHYEIAIDLKNFFAQKDLINDGIVHFHFDNYTAGDNFTFNYFVKKQNY